MDRSQQAEPGPQPNRSAAHLLVRGLKLGALTGMGLAIVYSILTLGGMSAAAALGSLSSWESLVALPAAAGVLFCGAPLALALGVLPGLLLGALGGSLTGLLLAILPPQRRAWALLPGALVGFLIALAWGLFAAGGFLDDYAAGRSSLLPLFFWVAGPGLLLIGGLAWVGMRLSAGKNT
jgi:hypothetical protein